MGKKLVINGVVVEGHAVASGQSTISPFITVLAQEHLPLA